MEQSKFFNGSTAFYKAKGTDIFVDFKKRIPAALANGKDFRSYTDKLGNWIVRTHYNSAVVENIILPSKYFSDENNIAIVAKQTGLSEDRVRALFSPYIEGVNATDAQAWITLPVYKERLLGLGKWTNKHEDAYNKLMNNEDLNATDVSLFAQPLKTVHFELVYKNGLLIPNYNKQSEAVLIPQLLTGDMLNVLEAMNRDNVDHIITLDGKKSGANNITKLLDDQGNILPSNDIKFTPVKLSYGNLFLQQDLPTKEVHATQVGSQIQKNILSVANRLFKYGNTNGANLINEYHSVISQLSDMGKLEMHKMLGYDTNKQTFDKKLFYDFLVKEFSGDFSENVLDALRMQMPLDAIPQVKRKLENKINAVITKATVKLKQPGGAFIQMADFGFIGKEKKLNQSVKNGIIWLKDVDYLQPLRLAEEGGKIKTKRAQILLPYSTIVKMLDEYGVDYKNMTSEEISKYIDPKVLRGVSYRIPNQGASSNDAFEIVGILPREMGDTMIAFNEITTKTGSDFDIDKSFVILPNFAPNFDYEGIFQDVRDMLPEGLQNAKFNMSDITQGIEKLKSGLEIPYELQLLVDTYNTYEKELKIKHFNGIKYVKYNPTAPTKAGLQNRRLEIMDLFMTHPDAFIKVMAPLDDDTIIKNFITALFPEAKVSEDLDFWTGTNQMITKSVFDTAKSLVGAIANHMVHHPLSLQDDLKWTHDASLVSEEYSKPYKDGSVKTVESALGAFMNAIVDAAKDPYIARANVNHFTASVVFMLVRKGMNPQHVIAFIGQPIIKDLVEETSIGEGRISDKSKRHQSGKMKGRKIKPLDIVLKKYGWDFNQYDVSQFKNTKFFEEKIHPQWLSEAKRAINNIDALVDLINYKNSLTGLNFLDEKDDLYNTKQLVILHHFLELQDKAKLLGDLVNVSRSDTIGATKNINAAINRTRLLEKVIKERIDEKPVFINADKLLGVVENKDGSITFNRDRFLAAYYDNSVNESLSMFDGVLFNATPAFQNSIRSIALQAGIQLLKGTEGELLADDISEELYASIVARFPAIKLNKKQFTTLIKGSKENNYTDSLSNRLLVAKKSDELKNNALIKALDRKPGFGNNPDVIVFSSRSMDIDEKNDTYLAWEEVLNINKSLGEDLIRYAFYTSGFRRSFGGFYEHIPSKWLRENGFDKYINDVMQTLNDVNALKDYEVEVFQHLYKNNRLVPMLPRDEYLNVNPDDNYIISLKNPVDYIYGYGEGKRPLFKEFLKVVTPIMNEEGIKDRDKYTLYRLIGQVSTGDKSDAVVPYYMKIPTLDLSFKGTTIKEYNMDTSIFLDNTYKLTEVAEIFLDVFLGIEQESEATNDENKIFNYMKVAKEEVEQRNKQCNQ